MTPWDRGEVPGELVELVEGANALTTGRALDLGCGTGTQTVYLARHGWQVTAVDLVARALRAAQRKAREADVTVRWILGDVGRIAEVVRDRGYSLFFDYGCFHGLADPAREGYAAGVSAMAAPDAHLLIAAFAPGRRGPLPRGVDREEIERRFSGWALQWARKDRSRPLPRFLANADPTWYLLRRR